MRLNSIRVMNYKGFADSGCIELGKDWTVIVGRNNSGKTSLLECFAANELSNRPHLHIDQDRTLQRDPVSRVELSLEITTAELQRTFLNYFGNGHVPVNPLDPSKEWIERVFFRTETQNFQLAKTGGAAPWSAPYPSHGLFPCPANKDRHTYSLVRSDDHQSWTIGEGPHRQNDDSLAEVAGRALVLHTYVFRPERKVSAASPVEHGLELRPDASNLASAIHYLYNTNRHLFDDFLALVQRVLPEIEMVDAPPEPPGAHIRVWNSGFNSRRSELAVGLEFCGTGVGQVLAILFVVVTAITDKIIVIDEPNSYLHPGASRALMGILRAQKRHQFIVSTHSPEIMSVLDPDKLVVMRWSDGRSQAEIYNGAELSGVRSAFDEVGVRLADVFGYDRVIWLEGQTEVRCIPMLLEAEEAGLPLGLAFVPLSDTGSLEGRNAKAVWRAYQRLSQKSIFVPETVSIGLDSEGKDSVTRNRLAEESHGLIRFLPRRTYENFLIHPEAIAALMQNIDPGRAISADTVRDWIGKHQYDAKYYSGSGIKKPVAAADKVNWEQVIDASRFLQDLVGTLSEQTQDFKGNKVKYSSTLTAWLLAHDRNHLSELIGYAKSLLVRSHLIARRLQH